MEASIVVREGEFPEQQEYYQLLRKTLFHGVYINNFRSVCSLFRTNTFLFRQLIAINGRNVCV
jgi:hypothetical protein